MILLCCAKDSLTNDVSGNVQISTCPVPSYMDYAELGTSVLTTCLERGRRDACDHRRRCLQPVPT